MKRMLKKIAAKLMSVALLVGLLGSIFCESAKAQTRESMQMSIASFDALLAKVAPGQTTVLVGDMQWPVHDVRSWNQHLKNKLAGSKTGRATFHVASNQQPWSNSTVPYIVEQPLQNDPILPGYIRDAMFAWQSAANVRFVRRSDPTNQLNYAQFRLSTPNVSNSPLGMGSGQHIVNIASNAPRHMHVTHEIGHLLGYAHEQTRPDRDTFVTINNGCFRPGFDPTTNINFALLPTQANRPSDYGQTVGTYDFRSIMHYPARDDNTANDADPTCVQITVDAPNQAMQTVIGNQTLIEAQGPRDRKSVV